MRAETLRARKEERVRNRSRQHSGSTEPRKGGGRAAGHRSPGLHSLRVPVQRGFVPQGVPRFHRKLHVDEDETSAAGP